MTAREELHESMCGSCCGRYARGECEAVDRALRIVASWYEDVNDGHGLDASDLIHDLEQAGFPLPGDDTAVPAGGVGGDPVVTARQLDVLREVASGATKDEAAATLHVSVRTVEQHLYRAARNLGTAGRGRAYTVAVAMALGLIKPEEIRLPESS